MNRVVGAGVGLAALVVALLAAGLAAGESSPLREKLVTGLSQQGVSITATFSGEELLVYGAIERSRFLTKDETPPGVVLITIGPERPVLVRKQERTLGLWINRHSLAFSAAPSFYAISTSAPLDEMLDPHEIDIYDLGLDQALLVPGTGDGGDSPETYHAALVRLMRAADLSRTLEGHVRLVGNSLFESSIRLPSNIFEGDYRIRVLLARDRQVVDTHTLILPVRRAGIERWIYRLAHDEPLGYGVLSIVVAVLAGWIASQAFRRFQA